MGKRIGDAVDGNAVQNRVELVLNNDLGELERLAAAVDDFIESNDLPPDLAFKFNLCFDELITNTVSYGYDDGGPHQILVRLEADGGEMRAEVVDDGLAFDPFADAPAPDLGDDIDDRRVGGLGVFLVKKMMDRAVYRREEGRNLILMAKVLT